MNEEVAAKLEVKRGIDRAGGGQETARQQEGQNAAQRGAGHNVRAKTATVWTIKRHPYDEAGWAIPRATRWTVGQSSRQSNRSAGGSSTPNTIQCKTTVKLTESLAAPESPKPGTVRPV